MKPIKVQQWSGEHQIFPNWEYMGDLYQIDWFEETSITLDIWI
jgi:hypothetical protein